MDIEIPKGDSTFDPSSTGKEKIEFKRATISGTKKPRHHPTVISSFIDGTNVYGEDHEGAGKLRTYKDGKMKVSDGNFLPWD